jgi:hypothetical protein
MSSPDRAIIEAVQKLTGTQLNDNVKLLAATVDSVDESTRTCIVTTVSSQGSITIENVQLMASVDDGFLLIPVIGSTVLVSYSTYNQPFVTMFSELAKVAMVVGDTLLTMTSDLLQFNDGALGGLVKVVDLVSRMNLIENKVNDLIGKYNGHTHLLTLSSGTGTAATTTSQETGTLTPTGRADIENDKIKQ